MASTNEHHSLWSFAVDNIKPQVDPLVFLLRHGGNGWASDALQNLGCAASPSVPRHIAFLHVPGSRTQSAVQGRSSCPWFECTSRLSLDHHLGVLRSSRYSWAYCAAAETATVSWECTARGHICLSPVDTCVAATLELQRHAPLNDLADLVDFAEKHPIYFHVDAVWDGSSLFSKTSGRNWQASREPTQRTSSPQTDWSYPSGRAFCYSLIQCNAISWPRQHVSSSAKHPWFLGVLRSRRQQVTSSTKLTRLLATACSKRSGQEM